MTTLGIDEERKRKVLSQVFVTESVDFDKLSEGLFEDETDDLVKADVKDLEKGLDPSKAKPDADVKKALDQLKSGDDESDEDKSKEGESKDSEEEKSAKIEALQAALVDAEKLEKIKKILTESLELDFEGVEDSVIADLFDYHKVI